MNDNSSFAREPKCRLCSCETYKLLDTEEQAGQIFHIVRCVRCGFVYINEKYDKVSPNYLNISSSDLNAYQLWLQKEHKALAFRQCMRILETYYHIKDQMRAPLNVLDIGCGTGGWIEYIKENTSYNCYGYDASIIEAQHAKVCNPLVRCAISISEYEEHLGRQLPKFDIVTLWDVLEHLREPFEYLSDIMGRMASGGLIYASVPAAMPQIIK